MTLSPFQARLPKAFRKSRSSTGASKANWRWALHRFEKRTAHRLIEWLIKRYHWYNTVLDTDIINAPCFKAKRIVMVNPYGQERIWEAPCNT